MNQKDDKMSRPFTIKSCEGWHDVTDELEVSDAPWTFAKPDGIGAFQLSIASYESGRVPNPTPQDLLSLVRDFGNSRQLGSPSDILFEDGDLRIAAASFRFGDDFLRIWYVSDGRSFAKVTYTCAWGKQSAELPDCERMVRTLQFQ